MRLFIVLTVHIIFILKLDIILYPKILSTMVMMKNISKKSKIEKKNNDMIRFGFIGRYSPQKNISMYLKAFSLFLNKYQYRLNVKLLMYGKGIESTNNELLKQIKKINYHHLLN